MDLNRESTTPILTERSLKPRLRAQRDRGPRPLIGPDGAEVGEHPTGGMEQAQGHWLIDTGPFQRGAHRCQLEHRLAGRAVGETVGIGQIPQVGEFVEEVVELVEIGRLEIAAWDAEALRANGTASAEAFAARERVAALRGVGVDAGPADAVAIGRRREDATFLAEVDAAILPRTLLVEAALPGARALHANALVVRAHTVGPALGVGDAVAALVGDARPTGSTVGVVQALDFLASAPLAGGAEDPGAICVGAACWIHALTAETKGKALRAVQVRVASDLDTAVEHARFVDAGTLAVSRARLRVGRRSGEYEKNSEGEGEKA